MQTSYNIKRVHKTNVTVLLLISVLFLLAILSREPKLTSFLPPILIIISVATLYFIPINDKVKGFLFGLIPTISTTYTILTSGFTVTNHYIYFLSIAMITLYFESKIVLMYGATLNIILFTIYALAPNNVFGPGANVTLFATTIIMINGVLILLYLLTRWGKTLINYAEHNNQSAQKAVDGLEKNILVIKDSSNTLNDQAAMMMTQSDMTLASSQEVSQAMDEISTGIQNQTHSITDINQMIQTIAQNVENTVMISETVSHKNQQMMTDVSQGQEQVSEMNGQMSIIQDSIQVANTTVNDLENDLKGILDFLKVITDISSQTNLLALNASIESARAGEAGKGFAVVAEEIRKLAEQTALSVNDINKIIETVGQKSKEAVSSVSSGSTAIVKGNEVLQNITVQYDSIQESFQDNSIKLEEQSHLIQEVSQDFTSIKDRVNNIASISEQQSASSEEILATVDGQKQNIESLTQALESIGQLSNELSDMVSKSSHS